MTYCIIETEDGWAIAECREQQTAEEVAADHGGVVIDPGPYPTFDDATDALVALQDELDDDESSDVPGTRAIEGRGEEEG